MHLSSWCDRIIRVSFYLLFALVPLVFTPWNHELFEYNKMMLTYALTVIITVSWVIKMVSSKKVQIAKTPLDIPIWLFVCSQFVSTLFSLDPHVSWIGYYSRFNGGMWSMISYTLLYYAFVSTIRIVPTDAGKPAEKKSAQKNQPETSVPDTAYVLRLLKISLTTASVVALYGIAERLGIDKHLWVQDVQNRVFSTLGQPNWLAAYLATLLPLAAGFALIYQPKPPAPASLSRLIQHTVFAAMTILFFIVMLFTRSRSGLFSLAIADGVFWLLLFMRRSNKKVFGISFIFLHLLFAAIIFVNGSNIPQVDKYFSFSGLKEQFASPQKQETSQPKDYTAPLLEYGGTESGVIRQYVWQGAITIWRSSTKAFLIGTGTETFAFAFYQFRPKEHNLTSEWDFLYNKAHNEYLNYLATTGIVGLGMYLLFLGFSAVFFLKSYLSYLSLQTKEALQTSVINAALFTGWISILITNFFGFSVVVMQIFLFLFPAILWSLLPHDEKSGYRITLLRVSSGKRALIYAATGSTGFLLLLLLWTHWQADVLFEKGYRLARSGQLAASHEPIEQAIRLNPWEPLFHDEFASNLASLASAAYDQKQASLGAQLAARSLEESDRAIATSPNNVNFWKTRTKVYYALSAVDPALNQAAVQALERAAELSPNDPKIYYNLAILYGRAGDNTHAVAMLKKSKELKPNYRDAYFGLHVFYTEMKEKELAKQVLEEYLRLVDPNDEDFRKRLELQ